jgi:hypothetical protein
VIVAAHQPHFLPWLGYLSKIAAADVFVVMDDLQYEAQNFQNRNRMKINHGAQWLTVPLERGPQEERICDKRINNGGSPREHWQRRIWNTLLIHYGSAPHFRRYQPELEQVFTRRWTSLVDLDLEMLSLHLRWFEIKTPVLLASSLNLSGQKSERILSLCKAVRADGYLSGKGASVDYLDVNRLAQAGVRVVWHHFEHPRYPQRYPGCGFLSHLGALDMLLNCGPESARVLKKVAVEEPIANWGR